MGNAGFMSSTVKPATLSTPFYPRSPFSKAEPLNPETQAHIVYSRDCTAKVSNDSFEARVTATFHMLSQCDSTYLESPL